MKIRYFRIMVFLLAAAFVISAVSLASAAKPIILGCPLSTAFLYGWDAEMGIGLSVDEINSGGDVLPVEVFNRWKERFGVPIYQVYGSTEAGHVTYSLGLSTLWFTLFDKAELRGTLGMDPEKNPVGIVCIGSADGEIADVPRKDAKAKTFYL